MSRELLKRAFPELMHFQFANDSAIERHNKLIAEIKAELSKPEPEPEPEPVCFAKWEPMETAPKDGTEVLLFALFDIGLCYWSDKMDSWTWGAGNRFNNPSHWMPLPEIPSKGNHLHAQPEPLSDGEINEGRYKKLRRWMSSNVREGWQEVKNLAAIAVWEGWDAFDSYLDEMPECNVGLCQTGENNGT